MAVIIRGMEMPDCCNDCRMAVWRMQQDGSYIVQCQALEEGEEDEIDWRWDGRLERLENCPLQEVRTDDEP